MKKRDSCQDARPFHNAKPDRLRVAREGNAEFAADGSWDCLHGVSSHSQLNNRHNCATRKVTAKPKTSGSRVASAVHLTLPVSL